MVDSALCFVQFSRRIFPLSYGIMLAVSPMDTAN